MASIASERLDGKVMLITGGNAGIGKEAAVGLALKGASIVIVSRSPDKGQDAVREIRQRSGNLKVDFLQADLSSLDSVRRLAEDVSRRYPVLHGLLNNAGAVYTRRAESDDGFELTLAVNHLSHFLLTHLLLPRLKAAPSARIINVSSDAHRMARFDFDDLMLEGKYSTFKAYGQSKLANIMFTYALARRLEGTGITVNALHPGVVGTGLGQNNGKWLQVMFKVVRYAMLTPEEGARTLLYLASSPTLERISGKYFYKCREIASNKYSYDVDAQERLFEVSAALVRLEQGA